MVWADALGLRRGHPEVMRVTLTLLCGRAVASEMYIPPGFSQIVPYLFLSGADNYVAFLVVGFGGEG